MIFDWLIFLLIGFLAGLLSGMLGLGGGVVIVPGLVEWFDLKEMTTPYLMQISIGTSLCAMALIALMSGLLHRKVGSVHWPAVKSIAPGMILGAIIGVQAADAIPSSLLKQIFACLLLILAFRLVLFPTPPERHSPLMKPWQLALSGLLIGGMSGMMGIGGGIMLMPLLIFNGLPLARCPGTALWCTLPTVTMGAGMAMWAGWDKSNLPDMSLGYVLWPASLAIGICALLSVPLGVYLSVKLPKLWLQRAFALVLALVSIRMIVS